MQVKISAFSAGNMQVKISAFSAGNMQVKISAFSAGNMQVKISAFSAGNMQVKISAFSANIILYRLFVNDIRLCGYPRMVCHQFCGFYQYLPTLGWKFVSSGQNLTLKTGLSKQENGRRSGEKYRLAWI